MIYNSTTSFVVKRKGHKMRFLTYGLSADKLAGIETFLFNMNRYMPANDGFDYIVEGTSTIHQATIDSLGSRAIFISPKKHILQNTLDWNKLLRKEKKNKETAKLVYFNMYSLAWIVPIMLCKIHGYKVAIHAHNNNLHDCGRLQRTVHNINRFIFQYIRIYRFTNSKLSARFFFGKRYAEMVYNAIDTFEFAFNIESRTKIRDELSVKNRNLYGFAGRLENSKNPLFLIDVFIQISKIDKNASFIVCGTGSLMDQMKEQAQKNNIDIIFTGTVSNLQDYYQAMDLFILPSRAEGLGLVLIEAQASGLPCVASADVIPHEAKVTELLDFIPLEQGPEEWAKLCMDKINTNYVDRIRYSSIIYNTNFEITKEAPRLDSLLRQCTKR